MRGGDCIYDTDLGPEAAMDSAGVLWGYGGREELTAHGAKYVFSSPEELGGFLLAERV